MPLNVAHVENVQHPGERARVFYANVDLRERLSYARLTMSSFQRHGGAIFLTVVSSSSDSGRRGEGLGHVREFRRATLLNLSLSHSLWLRAVEFNKAWTKRISQLLSMWID